MYYWLTPLLVCVVLSIVVFAKRLGKRHSNKRNELLDYVKVALIQDNYIIVESTSYSFVAKSIDFFFEPNEGSYKINVVDGAVYLYVHCSGTVVKFHAYDKNRSSILSGLTGSIDEFNEIKRKIKEMVVTQFEG